MDKILKGNNFIIVLSEVVFASVVGTNLRVVTKTLSYDIPFTSESDAMTLFQALAQRLGE